MAEQKSVRFVTQQSFFTAVQSGESGTVQGFIEKLSKYVSPDGSDPISDMMAVQNEAGETPLVVAVDRNNSDEIFNYLIPFCDAEIVKIRAKSGLNVFHLAARKGNLGIVKKLLETWPELCKLGDSTNTTPLYSAVVQGHLDVVNAILDVDVSSIRVVRKNGKTALHTAARYGLLDMVRTLLSHDPGIARVKDKKGQTPLHMAAKGQSVDVLELILLAEPSTLNDIDKKGNTPIHVATRKSRSQIVSFLVSRSFIHINAINNEQETAMDLADKLQYGESCLDIREALVGAGGKNARHANHCNEDTDLRRAVSDIKHEMHSQFLQNEQTDRRVTGIAKELRKLHKEAVQNTTNSITVVAVLFASVAFVAIFNLPGQYIRAGPESGRANIAYNRGFQVFCILNSASLLISLAVVVVQVSLVTWDTRARRQFVSVVNKLMWAACICTSGGFLSMAFVVVGKKHTWMAATLTSLGAPMLVVTLGIMCFFMARHNNGIANGPLGRISKKYSCLMLCSLHSLSASDNEFASFEGIYAL